ncbi:MAG: XdhC family protein [Flavobacteriales bacterium]
MQRIVDQLEVGGTIGLHLGPHRLRTGDVPGPEGHRAFEQAADGSWSYHERLGVEQRIVILGAGHVGLALSRTMHQLGFHVHLMDDRADLNTMVANQWAHERTVVDYARIGELISDDPGLYVVLVSFGYRTDDILVRQLIRKRFKYLGMMGSAEKIRTLLEGLRKDGFSEEEIGRVRAPIGLPIGSKTPEEIAVSIAAEIIGVKNGMAMRDSGSSPE